MRQRGSSTDVFLDDSATFLTLYVAAPVKLAVASLDHSPPANVEAATAAHELAAVDAARRPVADAAVRADRPGAAVRLAEVGRVAQVDEVGVGRRLELRVPRHQLASGTADELLLNLCTTPTANNVIEMWYFRRLLRVSWIHRRGNQLLLHKLNEERQKHRRKIGYYGHVMRSDSCLKEDIMQTGYRHVEGKSVVTRKTKKKMNFHWYQKPNHLK